MAAGSRKKYALDLNDIIAFPDAGHMPVFPPEEKESWILLMEITADESIMRPVYAVRDTTKTRFVVALYTPNPQKDAKNFKVGHTLCITSARLHQFLDGQTGFRIEDPSTIEVLPVSMAKLWEINAGLRKRSDEGDLPDCNVCNSPSKLGCAVCKSRYCSKECQRTDWPRHKKVCAVLKALHKWNRTDWG